MRQTLAGVLTKTSTRSRPAHIALACGMGILGGSAFQSPVLALALVSAALILPTHLAAFTVVAIATASIATVAASPLAALGSWSLTHPNLLPVWDRLNSMPLVPWLGLYNTFIHGSLLVAIVTTVPTSALVYLVARHVVPCVPSERRRSKAKTMELDRPSEFKTVAAGTLAEADRASLLDSQADLFQATSSSAVDPSDEGSFVELSEVDLDLLERLDFDSIEDDEPIESKPPKTLSGYPVELSRQDSSHKNPLSSFDAIDRLEELLSGCRVQPHWSYRNTPAAESIKSDADDECTSPFEDDPEVEQGASTDEVLARSHEMIGLVDQLLGTLADESEASQWVRTDSEPAEIEVNHSEESITELRTDTIEQETPSAPILSLKQPHNLSSTNLDDADRDVDEQGSTQLQFIQAGHEEALQCLLRHLKKAEEKAKN